MKAKKWIAIALAVVTVGGGTGLLAAAMAERQDIMATAFSSVSGEAVAEQKTTQQRDETEYKIEMDRDGRCLKKTEADMSPEKAVNLAVQEIRNAFGDIAVEKVTGVGLVGNDHNRRIPESCHAYSGMVYGKGNETFEFLINSITAQVISMMKIPDRIDPMQVYTSRYENLGKELEKEKGQEKYNKIALDFIPRVFKEDTISGAEAKAVVCAGGPYYFRSSWKMIGIQVEFMAGDCVCDVTIDPETDEIFAWDILLPPE